jgi:hypothetical protein
LHIRLITDISRKTFDFTAGFPNLLDRRAEVAIVAAADKYFRALPRITFRNRPADAAAAAGYECRFS